MSEAIASQSLWIPRRRPDNEPILAHSISPEDGIRTPQPEEFRLHFAQGVWPGRQPNDIVHLPDSNSYPLSALKLSKTRPRAVAFLDEDEIVGALGRSLRLTMYPDCPPDYFTHDYAEGMFFHTKDSDNKNALIRLVKTYEPHGIGMQPVANLAAIRSMVRSWRSAGVLVAFLTSAAPGAELLHVDFIIKHFSEACDGIVITRKGNEYTSKGLAASLLVDFVGLAPGTPVIGVDDLGKNTADMRAILQRHPSGLQVATFQHVFAHPSHKGKDPGSQHGATPLETFALANDYLGEQLGRPLNIPLPLLLGQLSAWEARQGNQI